VVVVVVVVIAVAVAVAVAMFVSDKIYHFTLTVLPHCRVNYGQVQLVLFYLLTGVDFQLADDDYDDNNIIKTRQLAVKPV